MDETLSSLLRPDSCSIHVLIGNSRQAAGLCSGASDMGYRCYSIDLKTATAGEGLLETVAASLAFPDYFGFNWDALKDCLSDMEWAEARGYVLVFHGAETLWKSETFQLATLLGILGQVGEEWASRSTTFASIFLLEQAPVAVPRGVGYPVVVHT